MRKGEDLLGIFQISEDEAKEHFTSALWKKFVDMVQYRSSK
jgi:hypothetical protein